MRTSIRFKTIFASAALGVSMGLLPQPGAAMTRAQNQELDAVLNTIDSQFVLGKNFSPRDKNERIFLDGKTRDDDFTDAEFATDANRLMESLDPHSHYFDAEETKKEDESGYVVGIGVAVTPHDNFPSVKTVFPGSPAEKGGMKKDDVILHVHDSNRNLDIDTNDGDLSKAAKAISGPPDTKVEIQVKRGGDEQPLKLIFTRARIEVDPVHYEFDDDVGYIKLDQFTAKAFASVEAAITAIESARGARKGYIFDLRNNPGGDVAQAISIVTAFAVNPTEAVITLKKAQNSFSFPIIHPANLLHNKTLIVLTDESTISVSEFTSEALKELGRARIYGKQSFGKASAWDHIRMPSGNILGLTTDLYYTPRGKSIQAQGVVPDVVYLPTAAELQGAREFYNNEAKKLKKKFPDDPDKKVIYNEASEKHAIILPDPSSRDDSKPSETCSLISETPAEGTPAPLIIELEKAGESHKALDPIKTCAWESLTGRRLNTRIAPYQGEPLRLAPAAP